MKKSIIIALIIAFAFPAFAAPKPDPDKMPVLKKLKEQGNNLAYQYLGRRFGMDAWLITGKGVMQMIYTQPNGVSAVVGGILVGPDGQEVSTAMQREFTESAPELAQKLLDQAREKLDGPQGEAQKQKPQSKSEEIWTQLSQLGHVTYVVKGIEIPVPILYAMLDPDQPESKIVFDKLQPLAEEGRIVLHVLPLLTTRADRLMETATVMAAKDAAVLWPKLLGGEKIDVPQTIPPEGAERLNSNVKFAQDFGLRSVPFMLYRKPENGGWSKVQVVKGVPKDWEKFLKDLESKGN